MSSHDQAAETLRDFVSTQVRKIFKSTHDDAESPLRAYQMRQAARRRGHVDRRKIIRFTPDRRQGVVERRGAICT